MSLKIEQNCDWCGLRVSVSIKTSGGQIDLNIPLPEGWERKPAFPGGQVGEQDGQELCETCHPQYDTVVESANQARDHVFTQAMQRSSQQRSAQEAGSGRKVQSSSLVGAGRR